VPLRHDNGSQYTAEAFQDELRFLGAQPSPSFFRSPEGNGCAERFIRTLKAQLLWVRIFSPWENCGGPCWTGPPLQRALAAGASRLSLAE